MRNNAAAATSAPSTTRLTVSRSRLGAREKNVHQRSSNASPASTACAVWMFRC
jgi:hypothetical protein